MISKEYGWIDEIILKLPYFRFCQIAETIDRRLSEELRFELEAKEIVTRFQASIVTLNSSITKEGKREIMNIIDKFSIFEKKEKIGIEKKKLPPIGSFEKIMGFFGGSK